MPTDLVGPVDVGPVAHGGHCVARHEGRVIFVRHTLPGERVMIEITDRSHDRFWRGDAVQVIEPAAGRVTPPCPIAGPGLCGGCDFQHVDLATQRDLKRRVVAEQLERLAGLTWDGVVEPVGDGDGLGWRTRMRYHAVHDQHGGTGRVGLRAHRSDRVIELPPDGCRIAAPPLRVPPPVPEDELVGVAAGDQVVWAGGDHPAGTVRERAVSREFTVAVGGFWQAHAAAPRVLADAVLDGLAPEAGETAFDLYCGVGLFAAALYDRGCAVTGVEGNKPAVELARRNLADAGSRVRFVAGSVDRVLDRPARRGGLADRTDLIVLDPPRTGAGRKAITGLARRRPRAIAYVACDPAALARDLGYLAKEGFQLKSLRAFDLFPMTHHIECVAILHP
ncbi:class I SAM-dependent RNA methyltransferase [Microlunatus sp. GCM10028923]|uniref:class I SAM-dependent RNA methyltransferase n=1 Tax=Microlunatus sp. GCM10028923 TaxID=3273400 RepID=UPI003619FB8B